MVGKGDAQKDYDKAYDELYAAERERQRRDLLEGLNRNAPPPPNDRITPVRNASERLKSLVDSSLGTVFEGFRNFPSNVSELKGRMQREWEARRNEELEIWRAWTGSDDSPDYIRMQVERASKEDIQKERDSAAMLLDEAFQRSVNVPAQRIVDLYKDNEVSFGSLDRFAAPMLSFGGACYYKPETVENLPSTARWGWPAPKQRWLGVEWFKRDPYSPIRLERNTELESSDIDWRGAFEELLCSSLGKPMESGERVGYRLPYGKTQSTRNGPGLDWMLSLQCRGILPPQLPSVYQRLSSRGVPQSVSDHLSAILEHVRNSPATSLSRSSSRTPIKDDFSCLVEEIAIKAVPQTEASPLYEPRTSWRVPETEEELYEQMEPTTATLLSDEVRQLIRQPPMTDDMTADDFIDGVRAALERFDDIWDVVERLGRELDVMLAATDESKSESGPSRHSKQSTRDDVHTQYNATEWQELIQKRFEQGCLYDPRHDSSTAKNQVSTPTSQTSTAQKPDVLSHLTTTQTTRLPDGTATTKVVLKQRFADGREETHETIQTSRADESQQQEEETKVVDKPAKRGWFWS